MFNFINPSKVGYDVKSLSKLKDDLNNHNLRLHTLIIAKSNNIFFNIHNEIYDENSLHRMYSVTKSLVSVAIGLLIDEKKIKLSDPISMYFKEYINKNTSKELLRQTIEDTLRMGTSVTPKSYFNYKNIDRIKLYFNEKSDRKCMERFYYDSPSTVVLSGIVEKVSKKDLFSYVYEKVLKYLDYFDNAYILKTVKNRTSGDSGLVCSTLALLSLAYLFLNNGKINNRQLLSKEYIKKATKKYLLTNKDKSKTFRYGYGYLIWLIKDGYAFNGMGNQIALIYPKYKIIVAFTGNSFDNNPKAIDYIVNKIHKLIINKESFKNNKLIEIDNHLDIFKNKYINKNLIKKYSNKLYVSNKSFISKFLIKGNQSNYSLNFYIKNKLYRLNFSNNNTTISKIKDIFSSERLVKIPRTSVYNLYVGLEKSSNNTLLFQGQIIGEYLGMIKLKIIFNSNKIKLILNSYTENFFNKYNGEFYFINNQK